jgi:hypothetical protein
MGVMTAVPPDVAQRLRKAAAARKRAEVALEHARRELQAAIISADDAGMKQASIVEVTGYNREHIRRIVRDEEDRRRSASSADH